MIKLALYSDRVETIVEKTKAAFLDRMNVSGNAKYTIDDVRWTIHHHDNGTTHFDIQLGFHTDGVNAG